MPSHDDRLSRSEITSIKKSGKSINTPLLSVEYMPLEKEENPRFTCIVSNRTAKRSVDRNKMKRRCREALKKECGALLRPVVGVVFLKKRALGASLSDIQHELNSAFRRITSGRSR